MIFRLQRFLPGKHLLSTWILSLWVNFVLLMSVVDLNRHERPVIPERKEMKSVKPDSPVKRLVVIHVDGLKPPRLLGLMEEQPKLKEIISSQGSWSVAYSPSYVTPRERMISSFTGTYWTSDGGFLNGASSVYFIGDPETANRFRLGKKLKRFVWKNDSWDRWSYISDDGDADEWVHKQILGLLKSDSFPEINDNKVVVIMRFIGVGMSSELEGENSLRAKEALIRILEMINNVVAEVERKWNDNQTTFAILSDTRSSPVLSWGPAISETLIPEPNPIATNWKSPYTKRRDMERRSIAPLLACVMDLDPPVESVASLPFDFLKDKPRLKALCAARTSKQVLKLYVETAHFHQKQGRFKISSFWTHINPENTLEMAKRIDVAYHEGDYFGVIAASKILIERCIHGLRYYGEFKRTFSTNLLLLTICGWVFASATWICPRLNLIFEPNRGNSPTAWYCRPQVVFDVIMALLTCSVLVIMILDEMPFRFISLASTSCLVWWMGLRDANNWIKVYKCSLHPESMTFVGAIYVIFVGTCWSFISDKLSLSIILVTTLTFASLFSLLKKETLRIKIWLLTCFPFIVLIHNKQNVSDDSNMMNFVSATVWIVAVFAISGMTAKLSDYPILIADLISLTAILFKGTPYFHAVWLFLALLPLVGSSNAIMRLTQIFFTLSVPLFLLSKGNESICVFGLLFHAINWYLAECYPYGSSKVLQADLEEYEETSRKFGTDDARRVFFYMIYTVLSMSAVKISDHFIVYDGDFCVDVTKEVLLSGLYWSAKGFVPITCLTCLLVLIWKKTNGDELALGLSISFTCSLVSFLFLFIVLIQRDDVELLQWSVSHYFVGEFVALLIHVSFPIAYILTSPSLISYFNKK